MSCKRTPVVGAISVPPLVVFVDELRRFLDSQMPAPKVGDVCSWTHSLECWGGTLLRSGWGMTRHPCQGAVRQLGVAALVTTQNKADGDSRLLWGNLRLP